MLTRRLVESDFGTLVGTCGKPGYGESDFLKWLFFFLGQSDLRLVKSDSTVCRVIGLL